MKKFKEIVLSPPMIIWLLLTLYHLINVTIKGMGMSGMSAWGYIYGFKTYFSICIFTFLFASDFQKSLRVLYYSLGLWLILNFALVGFTTGERLTGNGVYGLTAVLFGKTAVVMAVCGVFLCVQNTPTVKNCVQKLIYPVLFILLSQTRNAFGQAVIIFFGFYYSVILHGKINLKTIVVLIFFVIIGYMLINLMLQYTSLGDRFVSDVEKTDLISREQYKTGTFFDYIVGERIVYYYMGWLIFLNNPITGIGLGNYQDYVGGGYPMHVEYMKHLAEGGIVGFLIWLLFLIVLFNAILRSKEGVAMKSMRMFTLGALLFSFLFSSSFVNQEIIVIMYCFILSCKFTSRYHQCQIFKNRDRIEKAVCHN